MNQEHFDAFNTFFEYIYQGNNQAVSLSNKLISMASTMDDLIDKDRPVSNDQIYKLVMGAMFEIQVVPLWYEAGLNHHMLNVMLKWIDANAIESDSNSTQDDYAKCYMLRAGIYDIFAVLAHYLHGLDWSSKVGPEIRKFYGETLKDYFTEMGVKYA